MTNDMMTLRTLLEKSSDTDLLREMIGFTAQRLMALEVEGLTGAAPGERSPDRINQRNGYRDRVWENPCWDGGAAHSQAQEGQLLPSLLGAAPDGGESSYRCHSGSVRPRRLNPFGR
jgi:putative transposase